MVFSIPFEKHILFWRVFITTFLYRITFFYCTKFCFTNNYVLINLLVFNFLLHYLDRFISIIYFLEDNAREENEEIGFGFYSLSQYWINETHFTLTIKGIGIMGKK